MEGHLHKCGCLSYRGVAFPDMSDFVHQSLADVDGDGDGISSLLTVIDL